MQDLKGYSLQRTSLPFSYVMTSQLLQLQLSEQLTSHHFVPTGRTEISQDAFVNFDAFGMPKVVSLGRLKTEKLRK